MQKIKSTVLFIDDSKTIRETFKSMVKDFIGDFYVAENGEEGFHLYLEHKPDIIITDIEMPVMDGLTMSKKIRAINENIPIVIISSHSKVELLIESIKIGIKEFLFKPINSDNLKDTLFKISKQIESKKDDLIFKKKQEELINKKSEKLIELTVLLEEKIDTEIRKRLEKEVLISSIFDNAAFGICLIDKNKKIVKVNKAFCNIFDYEEEVELMNKDFYNLIEFSNNQKEAIAKKKSGEIIYVHIVKSKIEVLKNNLELIILTDVTHLKNIENERKKQEEMLIQQSKMASMGEMIGAIAHQWKQPLNVLAGNLVNLEIAIELDGISESDIRGCINQSSNQIQFMAQTIDDFRNFFKPTKEKTIFNVKKAISEIIELLMPQFKNNAIEVKINVESSEMDLCILGYSNEFKQVILNILNNSKDAILEKRTKCIEKTKFYEQILIILSKNDEKNTVNISICDNGGGIKSEILNKLFEPYVTSKGEKGTGIGLHLSKTIIENNFNGSIYAQNFLCINNQIGAKFIIEVPYAKN